MSSSTTSNRLKRNLHVGWNPDQKLCSISRADCNCSFMAFDNLLDDRKPQATSLAARRKHRVEDPGHSFILNSRSRIFDRDQYVASCDSPRKAYLPIHGGLANSVEFDTRKWIPVFRRHLHAHFTHPTQPFQPNPFLPFSLQFRRESLNPSLEFTVRTLQRFGSRLESH